MRASRGEPVERIAGFFVESELKRRKVITPPLPDMSQPTHEQHNAALDDAKVDMLDSMTGCSRQRLGRQS